jgi:glycosyltransferase involved in cell wall biosynthesis
MRAVTHGRCDLHIHSRFSTESGNYALRRARLGESYTEPERVYRVCRRRGMRFVTISDHNTLEGALRIAHHPDTFLSVEVTTRFPEDGVPLHVLVWNLTEADHRELQQYRPSVYELTAFLRAEGLVHALAHPLYRMGPPLTPSHVERMMILFGIWEGRNGARPAEANGLACRLAAAASHDYVAKLAERHGLEPAHDGFIALTGGSDDHGALDVATTFTEAPGETVERFLASVATGLGAPLGEHGSTVKLAHGAALQVPYLATAHHHSGSRAGLAEIEERFFGIREGLDEPRAMVFTDTFDEANGVAGTMRRLAAEAAAGVLALRVAAARPQAPAAPGVTAFEPDWTLPLPTYEQLELRFPVLTEVLASVERERPDVIHVATPGPLGVCGLASARLLGIPLVGSYHTELGPYALHLTQDLLVAQALDLWVDWFYRQCALVLAPTRAVAGALAARGLSDRIAVWGRGVDTGQFSPGRHNAVLRRELLRDGDALLLSVGRLSAEKGLAALLEAFRLVHAAHPGARLAIVGDGPARAELEAAAPSGVSFLGELRGDALAEVYASADVFCFPSTTDTFGQVLLEAASSALPVVAAASGGAVELVEHERTGRLVAPGDVQGFAAALLHLASDAGLRQAYGAQGRSAACRRTWQASYDELRFAYRSVARPAPARRPPTLVAPHAAE